MPATEKKLSSNSCDFIDEAMFESLLADGAPDPAEVREVLAKSMEKKPLSIEECACLLRTDDRDLIEEMFDVARQLKRDVYGNRIVIFAPLYIGNKCHNDCLYCTFRSSNSEAYRRTLSREELVGQVEALEDSGHKRLILVWGEHDEYNADNIAECVETVYGVKKGRGEIRRVNINAAPLDHEGYKTVHEAGIGTYQIFQETYHHETYRHYHRAGTKSDYLWRLDGLSRAFEAGCDDVGIGALFGLYDWKFDILGLVQHAIWLKNVYGVGPHTISFPRLRPALGSEIKTDHLVSDFDFKRVIAILRLAVPYTGLILTAREEPELRREAIAFGVTQIDAGSRIELGGYTEGRETQIARNEQFSLGDLRSLDEITAELLGDGNIPSFCTSCYRLGRTGEHFMEFAIPGFIRNYCTPNAIYTLKEYLVDYGSDITKASGEKMIAEELSRLPDSKTKSELINKLSTIDKSGERDALF